MCRFIFVTGGVVSSLGKGIAASALAALLQDRGFRVRIRKFDPYLNVDPGTMSPYQHGEVFVTEDGGETDLDLGHYERFTNTNARKSDSLTSGKIYREVIEKERRGDYLGATVQVIPHVTDMIKHFMQDDLSDGQGKPDFVIIEIGGTVGDIESLPFIEAIRQLRNELGKERTLFLHLTLVPYIASAGEIKTKPSQHSVKELQSFGIQPDILLCRTSVTIPPEALDKLALFCNVPKARVIPAMDVESIYEVPINYHKEGLDVQVLDFFGIPVSETSLNLGLWKGLTQIQNNATKEITIGIIGKYTLYKDAYKSLIEALEHAGISKEMRVMIKWIDSEDIETTTEEAFSTLMESLDGIIVPGGFGKRGSEGKIKAIGWAHEAKIPYLGICFGMQMAVVEAARRLLKLESANSTELEDSPYPVIDILREWVKGTSKEERSTKDDLGGTMRLGAYPCVLKPNSMVAGLYGSASQISERHRHRFEVNIDYREDFEKHGMVFSGMSPDQRLPEIIEFPDHPFFIGVQFHPELKSRPHTPHPLFLGLVEAAWIHHKNQNPAS